MCPAWAAHQSHAGVLRAVPEESSGADDEASNACVPSATAWAVASNRIHRMPLALHTCTQAAPAESVGNTAWDRVGNNPTHQTAHNASHATKRWRKLRRWGVLVTRAV